MLTRSQKRDIIDKTKTLVESNDHIVFVTFSQVPTSQVEGLRSELRNSKNGLKMVKKTLGDIAIKEAGIEGVEMKKNYKGSIGFVFASGDLFAAIKAITAFKKKCKDRFQVLGAILGKKPVEVEAVTRLASFPSTESVYTTLVFALNSNIQKLVSTLDQIREKKA